VPAAKESKTAAFYLATTTVSVGLLIDLLDSAKPAAWPALMDKADAPQGPMVWRHDRDWPNWQIAVAANWLTVEKAPADKLYWDKASVPRIERQTPLQQITGGMAVMVARLLNCRLPSAAEWQTACKMQLAAGQQLPWNIRGRTWQKQQEYVRQKRGESAIFANLPWADAGCFTPSVTDKINIQCDDQALAWQKCPWSGQATVPEDRLMFFRNVDADASGPFLHLIGNIDQFVCQWGNTPPLPDKFSAGDVENFLKDSQMAVIGASAISPPEMPYDQPFALGRHRLVSGRWSDVGIRLALPAVQKASATPLRQVIETASFIRIGA